jgi:hypothetical protein
VQPLGIGFAGWKGTTRQFTARSGCLSARGIDVFVGFENHLGLAVAGK